MSRLPVQRVSLPVLLALLVTIGRAAETPGDPPDAALPTARQILPDNPLEGLEVFRSKECVQCHTTWGVAGDPLGPDLAHVARDRTFMQLVGLLWSHSPRMIEIMRSKGLERPKLSAEEMRSLLSYLYFLDFFDESGDATRGAEVLRAKQCENCHSLGGAGGRTASPLDPYGNVMSPIILAAGMWNHSAEKQHESVTPFASSASEMVDLLAVIRARAMPANHPRRYLLPGNPNGGRVVFREKRCLECHAIGGQGGKVGPDLAKSRFGGTASQIAGEMWNHVSGMSPKMASEGVEFPALAAQEMADLLAYIYFVRFLDAPGDVVAGRSIYESKSCSVCHGNEGESGWVTGIARPLFTSDAIQSPYHLASFMWNHAPEMSDRLDELGLSWPRFQGHEMRDLVAYLQSFGD